MYSIEEFDKAKTKVLKYVIYKKRTQYEIKQKFSNEIEENLLEDVLNEIKENGYIDDMRYIERAVQEFMALKELSMKELQYKLYAKGINHGLMENYIQEHRDELEQYEIQSAKKILMKKQNVMEETELIQFLLKKGYCQDFIREAIKQMD